MARERRMVPGKHLVKQSGHVATEKHRTRHRLLLSLLIRDWQSQFLSAFFVQTTST